MRSFFLNLFLLCLILASCGQTKMSPVAYNNQLSHITDSLYAKGLKWGKKCTQIRESDRDFSKLKPLREDAIAFINAKRKEVNDLKPVGVNGENLKSKFVAFLDYESDLVDKGFTPIEKLTPASTEAEAQEAYNYLMTASAKEQGMLESIREAQASYAKENNFEIQNRTLPGS